MFAIQDRPTPLTAKPARQPARTDESPVSCERCLDQVWVVVAAYNEAGRIGSVLQELLQHVPHVVVVDDGSRDGTAEQVLRHPVWLLQHACNLGQGAALQTGIQFALEQGAPYVATFDADGQHTAEDLRAMFAALNRSAADFALGSRFLGRAVGIPLSRRIVLKLAILFTRWVSGVALTDVHNGIRLMTRRGAQQLRITMNRMEHASQFVEQILASGLRYLEVPVTVRYTADSLQKGQKTSGAVKLATKLLLEKFLG
ncbi:MAG: glycosyltransferase family 2 protein [Lentisphaeria bacterium]|jgi:glycosyltransferase involved in cell wall biosynthesis|nr:glycosyltransferase family 2 protein [Lentisphaeria bacterium]